MTARKKNILHKPEGLGTLYTDAALHESVLRFNTIADFTFDWEYWILPDKSLTYVSPSCERISGYRAEEFLQDPELLVKITHSEDRKKLICHMEESVRQEKSECSQLEFRIRTNSGEERWIEHACQSVYDQAGNFAGRRASNRDITERKQATKMLQRRAEIQSILREIAEAALLSPSLEGLYREVHSLVGRFLPSDNFNISFLNEASGQIVTTYLEDPTGLIPNRRPVGKYITEYVMRERRAMHVTEEEFQRLCELGEVESRFVEWKESIIAPLRDSQGRVFGAITLLTLQERQVYQPDAIEVLALIAAQISMAIERKQAEAALQEREAQYRNLFEMESDALFLIDAESSDILEANAAAVAMYGYSREELLSMRVFDLSAEPEKTGIAMNQVCLIGEITVPLRYNRKKDGTIFPVEITATKMLWKGRPVLIPAMRDISERMKNETCLRESEERLREVLENSIDVAYKLNLQTETFEYLSPAFKRMSGYSLEENMTLVVGKIFDRIHPEDRAAVEAVLAEVMSGPVDTAYHMEYRFLHKDGYYQFLHNQFTVLRDEIGKPLAIIGNVSDVTARKKMEDALLESEKRFRELIRDVNVIIKILNDHGRITFMNEYGLAFFGYAAEELMGKTEVETILPDYESTGRDLKKFSEEFHANSRLHQRCTHENITKLRRRVWVDWTNRYVVDVETGKAGWICVGVDVTAAKRAEQEQIRQYTRSRVREILTETINRRLSHTEMINELKQTGITLDMPFVVTLLANPAEYLPEVAPDQNWSERQQRINLLIDFLHASKTGIAAHTTAGILIIHRLSSEKESPFTVSHVRVAVNALLKKISGHWLEKEAVVGICHSTDTVQEAAILYEQARTALHYGPVLFPGRRVYHWYDLGCFQFIVKDLHSEQTQQFIQTHLGPILNEKNLKSREQDLETLAALLSGDSFQVIAFRLHVHTQTIIFRKKKLEKLLDADLDMPDKRMNLDIAMKLLSLLA